MLPARRARPRAAEKLSRPEAEQDNAHGFAEKKADGLAVFLFHAIAERRETALSADDGVEHGVHGQIGVKIRAKRAIGDALTDEIGDAFESAGHDVVFKSEEALDGPVARIHGVKLRHEADAGGVVDELVFKALKQGGDTREGRTGCGLDETADALRGLDHEFLNESPNDFVLVSEVLVDGGWPDADGGDDLRHGHAIDAACVEDFLRGGEDAAALALAVSEVAACGFYWSSTGHRSGVNTYFGQYIQIWILYTNLFEWLGACGAG